jgi:hypothetical protein
MRNSILLAAALAALVAACSSSGRIDLSVSSRALEAPPGRAQPHLFVTLARVDVHVAGVDSEAEGEGEWSTVFTGPQEIDLYDVATTSQFLASAVVPAGELTQVRLVLDDDARLMVDGQEQPVACPSCTRTGIKVVPHGTLTVPEGGTLQLNLLFDEPASLQQGNDGALRLDPVIRL